MKPRGPYKPTVEKVIHGILTGKLKKNETYTLHEASRKLGLHDYTLRDNLQDANRLSKINDALRKERLRLVPTVLMVEAIRIEAEPFGGHLCDIEGYAS